MDTTWKKEARTAKDDMVTDSNGRAERERAGVRLRPQLKIGHCGKTLLWPYVSLGTKRISEEHD